MEEREITIQEESQKTIPLFGIIVKRWLLIALITVLCGLLAFGYCLLKVKPTYTAKQSVILRTSVSNDTLANQVTTNVSLAKTYLPDVAGIVKSPAVVNKANEGESDKVSSGAISVSYGDDSLIFSVSYTDYSLEMAKAKLDRVLEATDVLLVTAIEAERVNITPTQNDYDVKVNSGLTKHIAIGVVLGLFIGVGLSVLLYVLDNTITDKLELERITGTDVLSQVNSKKDLGKK